MEDRQYRVTAYRWGDLSSHSVYIGDYETEEEAFSRADEYEKSSCGRYECQIILPTVIKQLKRYIK